MTICKLLSFMIEKGTPMWYHRDVTSRLLLRERRSKLSEKRKDHKGRILKTGESQRKDGIYQYRYTYCRGKRQTVYAPTLQELSRKEKEIQKQVDDGIDYEAGQITVIELLEKYISLKKGVRYNTQVGYNFVLNLVRKEDFGCRKISTIKVSDAKQWFAKLQKDGRGYSTITGLRGGTYYVKDTKTACGCRFLPITRKFTGCSKRCRNAVQRSKMSLW